MSGFVRITEVGPRDGLQNEPRPVPVEAKVAFVDLLSACGFAEIEVTSFVNPRRVPQLADGAEVLARIARRPGTVYSALVPNERGMEAALAAGAGKVAVFASASDGFSRANTGAPIDEVVARFAPVVAAARTARIPVRGYVSCVVRCPYDGPVDPAAVRRTAAMLLDMGIDDLDLGETLGVAVPDDIRRLYDGLAPSIEPARTTLHLHDTNGRAADNARAALGLGVRSFDASAAGLGGCPFAPGARGNVDTAALVAVAEAEGYRTGIDLQALGRAASSIRHSLRDGAS